MKASGLITLLTDFGNRDGYVGAMRGVMLGIAPQVRIVDISHEVPPQNVRAGSFLLAHHSRYFPQGAVHLAVVDPGVGSSRAVLLAQTPAAWFLAPDNGLLSFLWQQPGVQFFYANNPKFWLPQVSRTFHGRDIFAPLAAHLASGNEVEKMFAPVEQIVIDPRPQPQRKRKQVSGVIVYVDHFGNLVSNIAADQVPGDLASCEVRFGTAQLGRPARSYAEKKVGEPLAIVGSFTYIEVAINGGSAAQFFPNYGEMQLVITAS